MNQKIIECSALEKSYQDGARTIKILDGLSLNLNAGESLAIMGASGCGKSTLMNILGGLDKPSSGDVYLLGKNLSFSNDKELSQLRNKNIGFVYQMHHLLMEFSSLENVAMPLFIAGIKKTDAEKAAAELLQMVGLENRMSHKPSQLSGGERQRVAIARALVAKPACVLMDEPTGNLDQETAQDILNLIISLQKSLSISFVVVTHDPVMASQIGDVHILTQGRLIKK